MKCNMAAAADYKSISNISYKEMSLSKAKAKIKWFVAYVGHIALSVGELLDLDTFIHLHHHQQYNMDSKTDRKHICKTLKRLQILINVYEGTTDRRDQGWSNINHKLDCKIVSAVSYLEEERTVTTLLQYPDIVNYILYPVDTHAVIKTVSQVAAEHFC